jgi:hypothetical protein
MTNLRNGIAYTLDQAGSPSEWWSEAHIEYVVETNAWAPNGAGAPWRNEFAELVHSVERNSRGGPRVYMDTTTVWSAFKLTSGDSSILHAGTLMDLDTVTRAVVLNDRIFHVPSPFLDTREANRLIGDDVFTALEPIGSSDALSNILWDIWYRAVPAVANASIEQPRNPMERCWSEDSRRLFSDLAYFHGLKLASKECQIRADGSMIFNSDPRILVRHMTNDREYGDNVLKTIV